MVVTRIVNTVSGKEVENPRSVRAEQLRAFALHKLDVHLQDIKQLDPLWVYECRVPLVIGNESWHGLMPFPSGLNAIRHRSKFTLISTGEMQGNCQGLVKMRLQERNSRKMRLLQSATQCSNILGNVSNSFLKRSF